MNKQTFFLLAALTCACVTKSNAETEPFDRIVLKDLTVIKASLVKETADSLAYFELNDTAFVKHVVARDQVFKWIKSTPPIPALKKTAATVPDSGITKQQAPAPEKKVPVQTIAKDTVANKIPVVEYKPEQKNVPVEKTAPAPVVDKDSVKDSIPVVDYQVMVLRNDSVKNSNTVTVTSHEIAQTGSLQKIAASDSSRHDSQNSFQQAKQVSIVQTSATTAPVIPIVNADYDSSDAVPAGLSKVRLDPPTKNDGVKVVPRSGMLAINPSISIGSLGVGVRDWTASGLGFGANGQWLWGSESGALVNGELMLAFNKQGRCRWYGFGKVGYEWVTITTPAISVSTVNIPSTSMDLSFANICLGIGLEWRTGINRNHGWSFELGYQYGQADYTISMPGYYMFPGTAYQIWVPANTQNETFQMSPVYFGFNYSYYF